MFVPFQKVKNVSPVESRQMPSILPQTQFTSSMVVIFMVASARENMETLDILRENHSPTEKYERKVMFGTEQ